MHEDKAPQIFLYPWASFLRPRHSQDYSQHLEQTFSGPLV